MSEESASKPNRRDGIKAVLLVGLLYGLIGIVFAALSTDETGILWRRAAWLVSAVAFAVHIANEIFRVRNSPAATALHVSLAAALGAFALAVAANVHALRTASGNRPLLALALVLWPILTGVPAFLVALALAAVLGRIRPASKCGQLSFELLPLAVKTCVAFTIPALFMYEKAASQPGSFAHSVHSRMKDVGVPIQGFCLVACVVLICTGVFKILKHRGRQAIWDFGFALLALFCWSWAAGSMVKVR